MNRKLIMLKIIAVLTIVDFVRVVVVALGGGGVSACGGCLLYTSPSPRDRHRSRMPSSA